MKKLKRDTSMYWLWGNDSPVCPYCEHEQPTEELYLRGGEIHELQCESCNKFFWMEALREIKYSTSGDCKKNGDMPHDLYKWSKGDVGPWTCQKCFLEFYDWKLPGGDHASLEVGQFTLRINPNSGETLDAPQP